MRVNGAAGGGGRGKQNHKGVADFYAVKYALSVKMGSLARTCTLTGFC